MNFFLNLSLFFLFCLPGVPLGIWLCGRNLRRQPEGLFYGLLLGHLISTGLVVALGYLFSFSWPALVLYLVIAHGLVLISLQRLGSSGAKLHRTPPLRLRPWTKGEGLVLLASLVVFLALALPPQLNMGRETSSGHVFYGSFASDSLKNRAIIAELSKGEIPPPNPYFSGETLHYYWLFYVAPAAIYKILGEGASLQDLLTWHTLLAGGFFLVVFFSGLRLYTRKIPLLAMGMFLILLATNYKGFYLWWTFPGDTRSFINQVLDHQVETIFILRTWRVSLMGLYRFFLVAPQHLFALALFLMGWTLYLKTEADPGPGGRGTPQGRESPLPSSPVLPPSTLGVGFILGALFGYSSFIGLVVLLWYGGCLFRPVLMDPKALGRNLTRFFTGMGALSIPLLAFYHLEMIVPGGTVVRLDLHEAFLKDPIPILLVNLGPNFILGTLGALAALWKFKGHAFPNLWLMVICLFLFTAVMVRNSWEITIKSGMVLVVVLTFFSVEFLDVLGDWLKRKRGIGSRLPAPGFLLLSLVLLCLPAVPTVLLDAYNYTRSTHPTNAWFISLGDMEALTWVRANLPEKSLILDAPRGFQERDEEVYYAKIPSFAHRRTVLGDKVHTGDFQILEDRLISRKKEIDTFFETYDLAEAMAIARRWGIEYVYVGPVEKTLYPLGLSKFTDFKNLFHRVYRQKGVSIFRVLEGEPELVALRPLPLEKTSYRPKEALRARVILQNHNSNHPVQVQLTLRSTRTEGMGGWESRGRGGCRLGPGEEKVVTLQTQVPESPGIYQVEIVGKILLEVGGRVERVSFQSETLPYLVGRDVPDPEDSTGISRAGLAYHSEGFLTYGPYVTLPAREYLALFRLKGKDFQPGKQVAALEVATNKGLKLLAKKEIFSEDFLGTDLFQEFEIPFKLDKAREVEFRTYFKGHGELFVDKITVLTPKDLNERKLMVFRELGSPVYVE